MLPLMLHGRRSPLAPLNVCAAPTPPLQLPEGRPRRDQDLADLMLSMQVGYDS